MGRNTCFCCEKDSGKMFKCPKKLFSQHPSPHESRHTSSSNYCVVKMLIMLHTIHRCSTCPWFAETTNTDIVFCPLSFMLLFHEFPTWSLLCVVKPLLLSLAYLCSLFHPSRCHINAAAENTKVNPNLVKLSCHSSHCCHPVLTPGVNLAHKQHSQVTFLPKFQQSHATFIWLSQLQILIMCNYTPRSLRRVIPHPRGAGDTHACRSTRA